MSLVQHPQALASMPLFRSACPQPKQQLRMQAVLLHGMLICMFGCQVSCRSVAACAHPKLIRCVSVLCHRVNALAGSGKSFTLRLLQLIHADKTIL